MKILVVSPSLSVGGIGRHLLTFSEEFLRLNHEVTMISCFNQSVFYGVNEKITVVRFPIKRRKALLNTPSFYLRLVLFIRQEIKKIKPDFVLVFGEIINPLVILSSTGLSIPVFIGDMTSPDFKYGYFTQILRKLTYPYCNGLVCQTKHALNYKRKQFGDKINMIVLDNPIRKVTITNTPRENIILFVGRFAWEKGPDRLIRAFSKVENKKDWRLVMAGDGPLLEDMKILAKELKVADQIDFLGKVKDVDKLYSRASIYVLPSLLEGFPNALCEAMIAGLPAICFDSFPSNEIIEHGHDGIIIKDGDIEQMALIIQHLTDNPSERKRLGSNALKIVNRLDKQTISMKLLDFIKKSSLVQN